MRHFPNPFARVFRVAESGDRPFWNAAKTVIQSIGMWGVFYAALPAVVYWVESRTPLARLRWPPNPTVSLIGCVLFWAVGALTMGNGLTLAVIGQGTPLPLDTARHLVVRGAYRYIRNPLATGSILQAILIGVWFDSPAIIAYSLSGAVFWNLFVRPAEEADLERRFGEPYRRYRAAVRCWVPRLRPYHPEFDSA